jgi:Bacterial pre-peptidase C-terminal domain/Secretion system C-terminal sorting domain
MKKLSTFFILLLLAGTFTATAQVGRGGKPYSFTNPLNDQLDARSQMLPRLDVALLRSNARSAYNKGEILQAGQILPTHFTLANSGQWTTLPNGDRIWRLKIEVPDAPATSLYYEDFNMPKGASLYIYNDEKTHLVGSFGDHNNTPSRFFATEIIYTNKCVVEYYEPANVRGEGSFTISGVSNVFNAPDPPAYIRLNNPKCCGFGTSGSCEVNANCPEGNNWANQKRSVARIIVKDGSSQGFCSGALINNVNQDCKNYFLTANHCGAAVSAADKNQWIFYFNYQSAACANPASEPSTSNTVVGCTMRSSTSNGANNSIVGSDLMLVEFNGAIPASYNVYYAGWDANNTASASGVSIHHPAGDIKKISTYTTALTSVAYGGGTGTTHWNARWASTVTSWGVTEGGSSGSPLFNSTGRINGKLSGGPSACGVSASSALDYYGKLSYDWTSGGSLVSQQLKPWLDPGNTGTLVLDGKNACGAAPGCVDIQEANNTQANAGTIAVGTTYNALIANATDQDYYKFTISGSSNVTVSLTTLPFDYELQLLNSAGTVLGSSTAGGTTSETITSNGLAAGTYTVRVFGYNSAFSATSCYTLRVTAVSGCANIPEPNESLAAASLISVNTAISSQIASSTDVDWYRFTNSAAQPNINILLSNLPGDYDVYLYNTAGTLLGSSTAGGTTSESIVFNTSTVGTYYVRVIGYNGVSSTTVCYLLRANTSSTPKVVPKSTDITKFGKGSLSIYPNPTNRSAKLIFSSETGGTENIQVTDLMGRTIINRSITINPGVNQFELNLPATVSPGIYLVRVGSRTPVKLTKE